MMVHQIDCDWLIRLSLAEMYVLDDNCARSWLEYILGEQLAHVLPEAKSFKSNCLWQAHF